jgi:hypothetical protein
MKPLGDFSRTATRWRICIVAGIVNGAGETARFTGCDLRGTIEHRLLFAVVVWDSNQICYRDAHRDLWCVGAAGGSPRRVLQDVTSPQMAPNGHDIFFIRVFQGQPWLYRSSTTGEAQRVGKEGWPPDLNRLSPVSPDGSSLIATTRSARWLVSLASGERRPRIG